jgi:4-hydroxybenzoate polyprenyltransferase
MRLLSDIGASLKIVSDVLEYRIRKKEMANLFAALSIMIALHLETLDVLVRLAFAFFLNILVYLINDYHDIEVDLQSDTRERKKVLFLKEHRGKALATMVVMMVLLCGWALAYYPGLLVPLFGGAGVCWLYSARLKDTPLADLLAMALWGGIMPATGIRLDSPWGWLLLGQLALFSSCFETIQTLRDMKSDARAGTRTTAVFLGGPRTRLLLRALILLTTVYGVLVLHRIFGFFLLIAAFIPLSFEKMDGYWNRVRLIFGLAWLAMLVQFYLEGSPLGLLLVGM